jgi:hypothetical protein
MMMIGPSSVGVFAAEVWACGGGMKEGGKEGEMRALV